MPISIYNNKTLPCMTFPFNNTHGKSKRYLGSQALTGKIYADVKITCKNDDEMIALHNFYSVDCKYGLEPFIFSAPLFGFSTGAIEFVGEFEGDFAPVKDKTMRWVLSTKIKVLGTSNVIYDDLAEIITDDSGESVTSDAQLHQTSDNIITYIPINDIIN